MEERDGEKAEAIRGAEVGGLKEEKQKSRKSRRKETRRSRQVRGAGAEGGGGVGGGGSHVASEGTDLLVAESGSRGHLFQYYWFYSCLH